jgi:hypothetical protein
MAVREETQTVLVCKCPCSRLFPLTVVPGSFSDDAAAGVAQGQHEPGSAM